MLIDPLFVGMLFILIPGAPVTALIYYRAAKKDRQATVDIETLKERNLELDRQLVIEGHRADAAETSRECERTAAASALNSALKRAADAEKRASEVEIEKADLQGRYERERDERVITESEFQEQKRRRARLEGKIDGYEAILLPAYRKDRAHLKDAVLRLASLAHKRGSSQERREIERLTQEADRIVKTVHHCQEHL